MVYINSKNLFLQESGQIQKPAVIDHIIQFVSPFPWINTISIKKGSDIIINDNICTLMLQKNGPGRFEIFVCRNMLIFEFPATTYLFDGF